MSEVPSIDEIIDLAELLEILVGGARSYFAVATWLLVPLEDGMSAIDRIKAAENVEGLLAEAESDAERWRQ